jgi:hypothetical protein
MSFQPSLTAGRIRKVLDAYPWKDEEWYMVEESKEGTEAEVESEAA